MLQWSALIDVLDLEGIGGNERVLSFFRSSAVLEFLLSLSRENLARSGRARASTLGRDLTETLYSVLGPESLNLSVQPFKLTIASPTHGDFFPFPLAEARRVWGYGEAGARCIILFARFCLESDS